MAMVSMLMRAAVLLGFFEVVLATTCTTPVPVNLGYSTYNGCYNATFDLNTFKGIRYARAPTGALRFQLPQAPLKTSSTPITAYDFVERCPQGNINYTSTIPATPYSYSTDTEGNEDCLFLSVYAPPNAKSLPVLLFIHGGGYQLGDGTYDPSTMIQTSNNGFIAVMIQYRLGAFGFLAGDEVVKSGATNAGLQDQRFALEWVQTYISKFGGNPAAVTVSGESAGGGSVLQHVIANGGNDGTKLFRNIIASSPYLPAAYNASDAVPNSLFQSFVSAAGCSGTANAFKCLVNKPTMDLQVANNEVTSNTVYGSFVFTPVVDGKLIRERPLAQLASGKINGINAMIGNNANEGDTFTAPNIGSLNDVIAGVKAYFPGLLNSQVNKIIQTYQVDAISTPLLGLPLTEEFSTSGTTAPYALTESILATGFQQALANIIAESTFHTPAYALLDAFASAGRTGFRYQFSAIPAIHGFDVPFVFPPGGPDTTLLPQAMQTALQAAWANMIIHSNPSPQSSAQYSISGPVKTWPAFTLSKPTQIDFNVTGGPIVPVPVNGDLVPVMTGPATNVIQLFNAVTWEDGRGKRTNLWRSLGPSVPY